MLMVARRERGLEVWIEWMTKCASTRERKVWVCGRVVEVGVGLVCGLCDMRLAGKRYREVMRG